MSRCGRLLLAALACLGVPGALACKGWGSYYDVTPDGQLVWIPDVIIEITAQNPDGSPMFLGAGARWGGLVQADVSGGVKLWGKAADYGPCPPSPKAMPLALDVSFTHNSTSGGLSTLCGAPPPPSTNHILVAERGVCEFSNKSLAAQRANASVLLIANAGGSMVDEDHLFGAACGSEQADVCNNLTMPTVMISHRSAEFLRNLTLTGATVTARVYARLHPVFDASSAIILALGASTAIFAAWASASEDREKLSGKPVDRTGMSQAAAASSAALVQQLGVGHAFGFVVMSSITLVLLFYYIRDVIILVIVMYCIAAISAVTMVFTPGVERLFPKLMREVRVPLIDEHASIASLGTCALATGLAVAWFFMRHERDAFVIQDLMSMCLCVHIVSFVRFSNLKACTALLSLALLYDVFWVFISPLFFSSSVMVGVATGKGAPRNGTDDTPPTDTIPMLLVVPKIEDWAGGVSLLGLGDIVLPGLLLSFALRADYMKRGTSVGGYFHLMCGGYSIGLMMAIFASVVMRMGQPALLYLVPCTLIPFLLLSWRRGELSEMWDGPAWTYSPQKESRSPADLEAPEWGEGESEAAASGVRQGRPCPAGAVHDADGVRVSGGGGQISERRVSGSRGDGGGGGEGDDMRQRLL